MKNQTRALRRHAIAAAVAAAFGVHGNPALAQLPTGPTVVNGNAGIVTNGGQMTITNSANAVLDWQSFNIGAQNRVRFEQPSSSSQVLNRVVGNDPSNILGSLSSNGGVWLVNPHGVLFGSNARIDVAGLVASALPVSNDDFLSGRLRFGGAGAAGGQVLNQGEIGTSFGGHVWLVGTSVRNEGLVRSPGGGIVLAAGSSIELVDSGLPNVAVRVTAPDNDAVNLGTLLAPSGGSIDIHGGIVNQQGIVRADSIGTDPAGRVFIRAAGDVRLGASSETGAGTVLVESADGDTVVQGRVDATSGTGGGGQIHLLGRNVGVTGHAVVDASGAGGGGEVLVGGDYQGANPAVRNATATYLGPDATVRASATGSGDGGKVILWSDQATRAYGTIEAKGGPGGGNGGLVETSGHYLDARPAALDVGALHGKGGTWLLDPGNIEITDCCSLEGGLAHDDTADFSVTSDRIDAYISPGLITSRLLQGTNVIIKTGGVNVAQEGDIVVASNIDLGNNTSSGGALDLQAHNDIVVNPGVKINLPSNPVTLKADSDNDGAGGIRMGVNSQITAGGKIDLAGKTFALDHASLVSSAPDTAIDITTDTLTNTSSVLSTPNGRWLVHLGPGYTSFPAADLGTLDYTFVQVNAGNASPARSGVGENGIMMADPLAVQIKVNAIRPYDGTTQATFNDALSIATLPGFGVQSRAGDGAFTGTFQNRNAGTDKPIAYSGESPAFDILTTGGVPVYGATQTYVGDIVPRPVSAAGLVAANKVYDGTRAATVSGTMSGILTGDTVTLDGATGQFDTQNAGAGKTVTISGGTLAGADAGNYTLAGGATTTADITPRPITAAGIQAANKVYDGTTAATLSGGFTDALSGDVLTLGTTTGAFDTKNVGTNKTVTFTGGVLAGADAGNYQLTGPLTTLATITPRPITVAGIQAGDKVYDGTTAATLSGGFTDALSGDVLTPGTTAGTFDTKNAGTNKTVTFGSGVLAGADAGNYQLTGPLTTLATITPRPITVAGIQAADKVYDGTTAATLSGGFTDTLSGDVLTLGTTAAQFDTKNAGTNKTVTFGPGVLAGADAGNYQLTGPLTTTAAITPRPLTIAITGPVGKEYDATTAATLGANQFTLNNAVAGDTLTVSGPAQGSYATPDTGQNKAVSATGTFQVGGSDAPNYRIGTVNLTSGVNVVDAAASGTGGSITPASLTYVAAPAVREPGLPATGLGGTVTGFKGSDTLASATTGTLAWDSSATRFSLPGTYAVNGTGLSADNYTFVQAPGNATALTMRFDLSPAKVQAQERAQDDSTHAIAAALRTALPLLGPRGSGGGVFDRSSLAAARTFAAVPIGAMNQDELAAMLAQRRDFKRKLFADAIYKLEIDPSLADVQPCATVADASTGACRITTAQLELIHASKAVAAKTAVAKTAHVPQIERKVVVLFGINDYADKTIPQLENAVPDVDAVSKIFAEKLGYEVRVVRNPDKAAIVRTLNGLAAEMNSQDSVVIYYAGHGYSLEKNGAGYWIPSDAKAVDPHGWISNNDVAKLLGGIRAKQMALISDSCYSGAFAREGMDAVGHDVTVDDVLTKRSVVVLSSGGDEPVADEGKEGHSIFAWNLMRVVGAVRDWKPGSTIFTDVQSGVKKEFPQTPKYGAVTAAGHERGGDYLFELR